MANERQRQPEKRADLRSEVILTAETCALLADVLERTPESRAQLLGIFTDRRLSGSYKLEIQRARLRPNREGDK